MDINSSVPMKSSHTTPSAPTLSMWSKLLSTTLVAERTYCRGLQGPRIRLGRPHFLSKRCHSPPFLPGTLHRCESRADQSSTHHNLVVRTTRRRGRTSPAQARCLSSMTNTVAQPDLVEADVGGCQSDSDVKNRARIW